MGSAVHSPARNRSSGVKIHSSKHPQIASLVEQQIMILVGKETSGEGWNHDEANRLEGSRYIVSVNKTRLALKNKTIWQIFQ